MLATRRRGVIFSSGARDVSHIYCRRKEFVYITNAYLGHKNVMKSAGYALNSFDMRSTSAQTTIIPHEMKIAPTKRYFGF